MGILGTLHTKCINIPIYLTITIKGSYIFKDTVPTVR